MPRLFAQTPFVRMLALLLADIALISGAVFLAFFLRFEGTIPHFYFEGTLQAAIGILLALLLPLFFLFNAYALSLRHVGTAEILSLWRSLTLGFLGFGFLLMALDDNPLLRIFPRSVFVMSYVFSFMFVAGLRLLKRIFLQLSSRKNFKGQKRVLIIGAGDAGEQLVRSMGGSRRYLPVCFLDDDTAKQGVRIHGVRVAGQLKDIPSAVKKHAIEEIFIAMPSAPSQVIKFAVELGRKAGIQQLKVLPSLGEILDGKVSLRDVREVQVEDLLGRAVVSRHTQDLSHFLKGKIILITGAAGSIGSELCRQIGPFSPSALILFDQDETGIFMTANDLRERFENVEIVPLVGSILNREKVRDVFLNSKPHIVFHAAAYKHVPLMEADPEEAVATNVFGTELVARAALEERSECFVYVSTDKAVNPTSVMGATKRVGEIICQMLNHKGKTRFISVRFGNVLDSRGNVIAIFREQIKKGGPVKITHPDMKRYFMTNPEACLLVMQAAAMGKGGEVFLLDMGEPIKIVDLAQEMIRLSGFEPDKDIPLVFSGMRPGEKLFEETLNAEEGTERTNHEKIFAVKLTSLEEEKLEQGLQLLKTSLQERKKEAVRELLGKLIPSYLKREGIQ